MDRDATRVGETQKRGNRVWEKREYWRTYKAHFGAIARQHVFKKELPILL
jgi:hypothetical protein